LGFGPAPVTAARRDLAAERLKSLVIWALSDNEPAVGFYRALGGRAVARSSEKFGAKSLDKVRSAGRAELLLVLARASAPRFSRRNRFVLAAFEAARMLVGDFARQTHSQSGLGARVHITHIDMSSRPKRVTTSVRPLALVGPVASRGLQPSSRSSAGSWRMPRLPFAGFSIRHSTVPS